MTLRKFVGLFQIGFLDLAAGAFIAHVLHQFFYSQPAPILILVAGSVLAVLPDIDLFQSLKDRKTPDLTHRNTLFHSPLLLLVIPTIILSFVSVFWAFLWALAILFHYLHDTLDNSGGIAWLSPFSSTKFSIAFRSRRGRRQLLVRRSSRDPGLTLDEAMAKKFYRPTPTSLFEAILPIILLITIILTW